MKIRELIILTVSIVTLSACSGTKELYNSNIPFSNDYAISNDGKFSIQIPFGWFAINNSLIPSEREIRIMSTDSLYYFSISELRTSYEVREISDEEDLGSIAGISYEMKKEYFKENIKLLFPSEIFKVNGFNTYGYLFTKNNSQDTCRAVILDTRKRYFEFLIFPIQRPTMNSVWGSNQLFSIQQAVIKTFRFN